MIADLFFDSVLLEDLAQAAELFFGHSDIDRYEEHESSWYVDYSYFLGASEGLECKVFWSDDSDAGDLRFGAVVENAGRFEEAADFETFINDKVVGALTSNGCRVCRVQDHGDVPG